MITNILESWTGIVLSIHFGIFILTIGLTLLLMKIKGAGVTLWYLIIAAATPILNIFLLLMLGHELIVCLLDWRRR